MDAGDVLGHLGLPANIVAVIWGAYGLYIFAVKLKNGKNGNGHGLASTLEKLQEAVEGLADAVEDLPKEIDAAHRNALETMAERIHLDARQREIERREHEKRA